MTKEGTTRIPDLKAQRIDTSTVVAEHATGVETATSHKNAQHMVNCGIMNHYTRVCNKRRSP